MTTVILVKKRYQVQEEVECGVHKLICTYSLSPVPERQKRGALREAMVEHGWPQNPNLRTAFQTHQPPKLSGQRALGRGEQRSLLTL